MKKIIVIIFAALFILSACNSSPQNASKESSPEPTPASLLPNKVAVVVCRDGYAPSEFHPVMDALAAAGYEAVITSDELGKADGSDETAEITATFNDFEGSDLRGIVVIGGSDSLWDNADLHRLLCEVDDLGRVTAGICLNAVTLAKAGVIKEGDEACWANHPTMTDPVMADLGVIDSGKLVTVSGNVITGNGPPASERFATEIVNALDAM